MCTRLLARLLLPALALLALAGCDTRPAAWSAPQESGGIRAALDIRPWPPGVMQDVVVELRLRDTDDRPLRGARIGLDLSMPAMEMPENRPAMIESEPGVYRAATLFTMGGEWRIRAVVEHGGHSVPFTFRADVP